MAKGRRRNAGGSGQQPAHEANLTPPVAPQPANLRPPPRGQPVPRPSPLSLDDSASDDSFATTASTEQQLRKRPSPVNVPGHAGSEGLGGRLLTGYSSSSSFPPAAEGGAVSADGRLNRTPSGGSLKAKGGSPRKGSPKSGSDGSPRSGTRRDFQPLDLTTARKVESMQSEKSNSGGTAARPRHQSTGLAAGLMHSQRATSRASPRWPLLSFIAAEFRTYHPTLTRQLSGSKAGDGSAALIDSSHYKREKQRIAQRLRVYNTLSVPASLERVVMWGTVLCTDSFLFIFTLLPLRVMWATPRAVVRAVPILRSQFRPLLGSETVDMVRAAILWIVCSLLFYYVDISKTYHLIRAQATIKLYVIYNVLEICDKMCTYIGPDVLDALYWTASDIGDPATSADSAAAGGSQELHSKKSGLSRRRGVRRGAHLGAADLIWDFSLAMCYVFLHSTVMIYQVVTLQVAMHSSNNALLTMLVSNNFVELKGSVFKKFEEGNLFQITAADMSERFQMVLVLSIMLCQQLDRTTTQTLSMNSVHSVWESLSEVLQAASDVVFGGGGGEAGVSSSIPIVMCILWACEMLVDWIKHAFIVKFNDIPHHTYSDLAHILASDVLTAHKRLPHLDEQHAITHRLGFSTLPRAALALRMLVPLLDVPNRGVLTALTVSLVFSCMLALKFLLSIYVRGHAYWKLCEAPRDAGSESESESSPTPEIRPVR